MDELTAIASSLSKLYTQRAKISFDLRSAKDATVSAELNFPAPADGWPGKNESERTLARKTALANDDRIRKLNKAESVLQFDLDRNQAEIDGLTDIRRSIEWGIRSNLVNFLTGKGEHRDDIDKAFSYTEDDLAVQAAEQAAFTEIVQAMDTVDAVDGDSNLPELDIIL